MGSSRWQWEWLVHQDGPFASCVEIHPHWVIQTVPSEFARVLEHSQNPHRVSSRCPSYCHSSVTSQASPRLQTWETRTSFTPMQRSRSQVKQRRVWRRTEKQALIWWTFALSTATKITVGFLFPGEDFRRVIVWSVTSPGKVPWVWQFVPEHVRPGAGQLMHTQNPAVGTLIFSLTLSLALTHASKPAGTLVE